MAGSRRMRGELVLIRCSQTARLQGGGKESRILGPPGCPREPRAWHGLQDREVMELARPFLRVSSCGRRSARVVQSDGGSYLDRARSLSLPEARLQRGGRLPGSFI